MNNAWRRTATLLTAIAILAAFALACNTAKAYETDKANQRIVAANADIEKYNTIQKQIDSDQEKINATPGTLDGIGQLSPLLTDVESKLKAQKIEIGKSIKEFEAGKALYIPGNFKTYFQMLIDVANKQQMSIDFALQANQASQEYVKAGQAVISGTGTEDALNAIKTRVDALETQANKASSDAAILKTKADKYYKDKSLSGSK
jgi:hypothetical protein